MSRERILAVLYDLAMVIGGEVKLKPLLTKTLQRLLYHTSFPAGLALLDALPGDEPDRVSARIEAVVGDFDLAAHQGERVALPAALFGGGAQLIEGSEPGHCLPAGSGRYRACLRLPIGNNAVMLLLAPGRPSSDLPLTQVFQPVMANLGKAILLCRDHEAYTEALRSDRDEARAGLAREMEKVVEERTLLRTLYNAIPDLVWLKDEQGRYLACNRTFERLCGHPEAEAMGLHDEELFGPAETALFRERDRQTLEAGALTDEEELTYPDGPRVLVETIRSAVRRPDGSLIGVLGVARDITERKRLEEELRTLNRELAARVEVEVARNREKDHILIQQSRLAAMGEMIHNIAHQWRQPLNGLAIILSNIKDDFHFNELTEQGLDDAVARARRLLETMSSTIDDFRDFFRPDTEPSEFDVAAAVENALFVLDASLRNNNIELIRELPHGLSAFGHANQFAQAVLNVVVNAKEAIQGRRVAAGRIRVQLVRRDAEAVLEVEDNAGGIESDVLARIFEPYFTTKEQGSGIGLYMTKMIMERNLHGTVRGENGAQGARFLLSLPLAAQVRRAPS